jgi:hypothetical protein
LADSDGLAIATQDTIHPPKILGKSKCMSNAILAILAIRSGRASSARHLHSCKTSCPLQSSCRAYAPFTVSSLVEYYKTCPIRPREFAHAFRKATLRVVQPIRPAMLSRPLGAPVFDAKSLASTSPRHVRNKTCIPKTAAHVLRLSQVDHDTPWFSAGSLSWESPTKVQWSFIFLQGRYKLGSRDGFTLLPSVRTSRHPAVCARP